MYSVPWSPAGQLNLSGAVSMALLVLMVLALAFLPLSATILLAAGGMAGVLLMRWPWLIWLGMAAAMPFTSGVKVGPLSFTDIALAGAALLWFADGVRRGTLRLNWSPVLSALCAYIGALLCATMLNAQNLGEAAAEVVKWGEVLVLILLIRQMVPKSHAPWLAVAVIAGGAAQSLLGLYQFFYRIGPEWFAVLGRFMRASGSFGQPNPFAGYLGLILPVPVSLLLWSLGQIGQSSDAQRRRQMLLVTIFSGGAAMLIAAGMLASWSRGGWLGALAAMIVVVGLRSRKSIMVLLTIMLAVVVILLAGVNLAAAFADDSPSARAASSPLSAISARFSNVSAYFGLNRGGLAAALEEPVNDDNFAIIERLAHWSAALRMWSQAPWFGVGPGNFDTRYPAIVQQDTHLLRWSNPLGHAHNIYLNVLAESGLVGLAAYLLFWLVVLDWLWRSVWFPSPRSEERVGWNWALAIGVIGIVIHLSIHNVVDNLFVQGNYLLIGFWFALLEINQ